MIILEVEDYCHDCPNFEADVENPTFLYDGDMKLCSSNTIVRCDNRRVCREIYSYFRNYKDKEKSDE